MSGASKIEWTNDTWNPVRGCSLVSPGCTNCYAMRQAHRHANAGGAYEGLTKKSKAGPVWTGKVRTVPELLGLPGLTRKPRRIFVNSMSDLFHEAVPDSFIADVWLRMALNQQHVFQILTKRPERMLDWVTEKGMDAVFAGEELEYQDSLRRHGWPLRNVWLGVSVEDQLRADGRIPLLQRTPAAVRWISAEPLLGPVNLRLAMREAKGILREDWKQPLNWVVAGGESGPGARPMHPDWARSLRDQCSAVGVPFFFKQHGNWRQCETEVIPEPPPEGGRKVYPINEDEDIGLDDNRGYRVIEAHGTEFVNVGKKAAGRVLDGSTYDEYPRK